VSRIRPAHRKHSGRKSCQRSCLLSAGIQRKRSPIARVRSLLDDLYLYSSSQSFSRNLPSVTMLRRAYQGASGRKSSLRSRLSQRRSARSAGTLSRRFRRCKPKAIIPECSLRRFQSPGASGIAGCYTATRLHDYNSIPLIRIQPCSSVPYSVKLCV
jgi:hypothetical protein